MRRSKLFFRWLTGLLLLSMLGGGLLGGAGLSARAAPGKVGIPGYVVISEFRTTGTDEFIEIFNRTNNPIDITNWKIRKSSGCGATLSDVVPIGAFNLAAGQKFLVGNSAGFTGIVDLSYTTSIADDGGIALVDDVGNIIDQVGMCSTTTYKEFDSANPMYLSPLDGTNNQSYERKNNGCTDNNNNFTDFVLQLSSNPQNSTTFPIKCLRVTNVTSTAANSPPSYTTGASIAITVEFSSNVNVTGAPILLLETGSTDRAATYAGGSGSNILTFNYTVQAGDVSADLDYVGTTSLTLNGGTITGAVGDADLALPAPGTPGSLGANRAIVIDNGTGPSLISFKRQVPPSTPTNFNTLTFRATFSEPVTGVAVGNFAVNGTTTATVTSVTLVNSAVYDVLVSGGNLDNFNDNVGLNLSGAPGIVDAAGNALPIVEPGIDEVYALDNTNPSVTINRATGQAPTASGTPVNFTVVFSEPINVSTFVAGVVTQSGTALVSTWTILNSGDPRTFTLSATAVSSNGTIIPSIGVNKVYDLAGNGNIAGTSTDSVQFTDNIPPSVTINQAAGQADPAGTLPIRFTVAFSEPILASIFTPSDITHSGTATGITWSIVDSGDHKTFTLSATSVSGYGTLIPSIVANRVTDLVGNNNSASSSTDNLVIYSSPQTLVVVINEVAWAGTLANSDDEWIELYNPTNQDIDLTGWNLLSADNSPNIKAAFSGITIEKGGYLLLEHGDGADSDTTNVVADLTYTGALSNAGEILRLYNPSGFLVDTANSNGGAWPAGLASTFSSMQRSVIDDDSNFVWVTYDVLRDTGTKAKDALGNDIRGTPGRANAPINVTPTSTPGSGTSGGSTSGGTGGTTLQPLLGISEFLPRPGFDWNNDGIVDVFDEFIEIINAGRIDVNLSAYQLDDEEDQGSLPFPLPSITLKPDERAVFYASETGILLSDAGDTVRLLRGSTVVDAYTYTVVRYPDQSWCRLPDRLGYWNDPCFPTPNNPNALSGTVPLPPGPDTGYQPPVCLLPDTTPDEFVYAECVVGGNGIFNRQYWDEADAPGRLELNEEKKWETVFE